MSDLPNLDGAREALVACGEERRMVHRDHLRNALAAVDILIAENKRLSVLVEERRDNLTYNGWSAMPEGVGTLQDNIDDMMLRGRHRPLRGEDHPNVVLSRGQVGMLWELRGRGWTTPMIAAKIGTGRQAVSAVLCGRSWSHVAPADRDSFTCPCGRNPKRGRTAHYQTCAEWQRWAETHDPELYGLIMRGRRAQATALGRYEAFVAAAVPYLPAEVLTMYADVIRDAKDGRIAHIRAALEAAPKVTP